MNKEDFRQATRTQLDAIDSEINTHGAQRQLALQNAAFRRRVENYVGVGTAPQNSATGLPNSNAAKESLVEDARVLEGQNTCERRQCHGETCDVVHRARCIQQAMDCDLQ